MLIYLKLKMKFLKKLGDIVKIIIKSKTIFNKEWNFESTQNLSPEVKDNATKIIEKALKSAKTILKNNL